MELMKRRLPCLAAAAAVLTLFTGLWLCRVKTGGYSENGDRLTVTVTTTMLYDLAEQIGGECVSVRGLMGSGVDPHRYRASAGDIIKLQSADVVIYSGLHLEGRMGDVFASLEGSGKNVICASDGIPEELLIINDGVPDPHIWFDVSLWSMAAEETASGLCRADPDNAQTYKANLEGYKKELAELDAYVRERTGEIGKEQRVLITAHDAFAYFGRAYGYEVRGLQGISSVAEAAASEVGRLADYIAEKRIGAVFVESSMPVKNIEALCEAVRSFGFETGLGGSLYSDSVGDVKSGTETYAAAFRHNIDLIAEGLKQK